MTYVHATRDAGYSLVELLIVMLLLSFITLAVSGGFRFGTRIWEATDRSVAETHRYTSTQTVLRDLIANAVPKLKGGYVLFEGGPRQATFLAVAPQSIESGGLVTVTIALERDRVTMTVKPERGEAREAVFATDSALRLSYLDASDAKPVWLDRWHDRKRFPAVVRIAADDPSSTDRWPLFIARLPIDQPPACVFDPVSLDCRSA